MAITRQNGCRDLLIDAMLIAGQPLPKLRICELGCQRIKTGPDSNMRRLQSSRSVLDFLGAYVVSIDINGQMGSLACDLSQRLPDIGQHDIVTDFGTLEHVAKNQLMAFANMHDLCRVGGLMVHALPACFCGHGVWNYTPEWLADIATRNHYFVYRCERWLKRETIAGEENYVMAILQRTTPDAFVQDGWTDPYRSTRGRKSA